MACIADHRDRLDVGAVGITGREADRLELLGDVRDRAVFAGRPGGPPLEAIGREAVDVLKDVVARDGGQCRLKRGG
jgi:hypothetical protein